MENTGFVFGTPNLRAAKVEKYPDFGVITLEPIVKAGGGRRLAFNPKAIELLGVDVDNDKNSVAFSFPAGTTDIYIANTTGTGEGKGKVNVKKAGTISDKSYHEYIKKLLGYDVNDDSVTFELKLASVVGNYNGNDVYKLEMLSEQESNDANAVQAATEAQVEEETTTDLTETAHEVSDALVENVETVEDEVMVAPEQEFNPEVSDDTQDFLGDTSTNDDSFPNF